MRLNVQYSISKIDLIVNKEMFIVVSVIYRYFKHVSR